MQLAILHYHLNHGGVTQVIVSHLRALSISARQSIERVAILFGGRREAWPDALQWPGDPIEVKLVPVETLEYDTVRGSHRADPASMAHELRCKLAALGMTASNTLLHVHNHSLGKNTSLPGALDELASDGYHLLLQIHDFAEDFRPENYRHLASRLETSTADKLARRLYPQASHVHYALLNGRDDAILRKAFPASHRIHLLSNPVEGPVDVPAPNEARRKLTEECGIPSDATIVVYPVRGIRRKNVGEALLWSTVMERTALALTRKPINPAERVSCDHWEQLSAELGLMCYFGTGEARALNYADNLAAADALLTTSVAEGFGMVFLEASLCNRPLVGRDLVDITADFKKVGVQYPWLRDGITLPQGVLDCGEVCDGLAHAYQRVAAAYGRSVRRSDARALADRFLATRATDFSMLTPRLQTDFIRRTASNAALRDAILDANPGLFHVPRLGEPPVTTVLRKNADVIEQQFGLKPFGTKLHKVYDQCLRSETGPLVPLESGGSILDTFLDLDRLHPVRLEP